MEPTTAAVCCACIFAILAAFALYRKGDVKAGWQLGKNSFFIETKERQQSR